MFKQLKMKTATRRVNRASNRVNSKSARPSILARAWAWIRCIDVIGMINLTLLTAIIVLFSMLIMDVMRCNRHVSVTATPDVAARPQITVTDASAPRGVRPRPVMRVVVPHQSVETKCPAPDVVETPAPIKYDMAGDIIIDARDAALQPGVKINGNLYLQKMRKFTLPCGTYINGNLFLRDVTMLHFCGEFTVTGNIYVSPRSSFGPIPRDARLGGQVIL